MKNERIEWQGLLNVPLPEDAIPFVIIHCYADVPGGTEYDLVFDPIDDFRSESTSASVMFGIIWERLPVRVLSHGWHQVALLRFPEGLPSLCHRLPTDEPTLDYLCLCSRLHFPEIRKSIIKTREEFEAFRAQKQLRDHK
jgi:hypothetical protein